MYGDHIWYETNVSGDYCYVGEQHCIARAQVGIRLGLSLLPVCLLYSTIFFKLHSYAGVLGPSITLFFSSISDPVLIRLHICIPHVYTYKAAKCSQTFLQYLHQLNIWSAR